MFWRNWYLGICIYLMIIPYRNLFNKIDKTMNTQALEKYKPIFVVIIGILIGLHVLWDYYNGGIPTHRILASEDLPGISNLWGILTVPILAWVLISLIQKRIKKNNENIPNTEKDLIKIGIGFIGALIFGITMSVFWEIGLEEILQYLIFFPVVISLLTPVHLPEHFLGFVIGMAYTFGGILPIGFGIIIWIMALIVNKIFRTGIIFIVSKIKSSLS